MLIFGWFVLHAYLDLEGEQYTDEKPLARVTRWHKGKYLFETFVHVFFAVKSANFDFENSPEFKND